MSFEMDRPMDLTNTNPNNPPQSCIQDFNGDCFQICPRPENQDTSENRICREPNNGTPDCYPLCPNPVADELCTTREVRGKV